MLNEFYLYDYAFVVNKIKSLNSELENLEGLRAVVIDDMPKGSNVSSTVENELLKIEKIKEKTKKQTEIIGKISRLKAAPSVDNRNGGEVVIIFLNENNRAKSVKAFLCKEDYEKAVDAHQYGKMVKIIGTLTKNSRPTLEDAIFVSLE